MEVSFQDKVSVELKLQRKKKRKKKQRDQPILDQNNLKTPASIELLWEHKKLKRSNKLLQKELLEERNQKVELLLEVLELGEPLDPRKLGLDLELEEPLVVLKLMLDLEGEALLSHNRKIQVLDLINHRPNQQIKKKKQVAGE